jgi:uncharacterized LabA/DUF88 family protein
MNAANSPETKKLAVLIDADNANPNLIGELLREIAKYGTSHVKRIYGDWTQPNLGPWKDKLNKFSIQPMQQFRYTVGKNATDSALIIDAMDLLYTGNFDGFCIVSSDSDFTRLASRIREAGLVVYGFGSQKTPEPFISACDKFIFTEILGESEESGFVEATGERFPEKDEFQSQSVKEKGGSKSGSNKKLIKLLKDAYEAISSEDEWVDLGAFGAQLNKLSPSFDERNYGYKKLSDLIRSTQLFEVKVVPHDNHPTAKTISIRLKVS